MALVENLKQPAILWKLALSSAVLLFLAVVFNKMPGFRSGPCTPGFDFFAGMLFLFSFGLFLICGVYHLISWLWSKRSHH
jgi:hypothetical protein